MKEKILPFIIGVLVGAIIATGGYYLYSKSTASNKGGMPDGNPPAMMQQDGNSTDNGTPPEKPADDGNGPEGTQQDNSNSNSTKKNKNKNTNTNTNTNSSESSSNNI